MARWIAAATWALLSLATAEARAQALLIERFIEQCNNDAGEFSAEDSIRGCTAIIRSDLVIGRALAVAYNTRAMRYLALRQDDRALADFSAALRYSPHYVQAYLNRAALYLVRRDYPAAIADYDRAVAILPNSYLGYGARCWARALWGEGLDLARADCDAALRLSPGQPSVLGSRGLVGLRDGRFEDAWSDYDAAAQSNPGEARYLYGRGVAAQRLGRTDQARADIAEATELSPDVAATFAAYGISP